LCAECNVWGFCCVHDTPVSDEPGVVGDSVAFLSYVTECEELRVVVLPHVPFVVNIVGGLKSKPSIVKSCINLLCNIAANAGLRCGLHGAQHYMPVPACCCHPCL
jgi:hypothetical protein